MENPNHRGWCRWENDLFLWAMLNHQRVPLFEDTSIYRWMDWNRLITAPRTSLQEVWVMIFAHGRCPSAWIPSGISSISHQMKALVHWQAPSDRQPSNYKEERLLDSHSPDLTRCHVPCDVHCSLNLAWRYDDGTTFNVSFFTFGTNMV
jgi:hypothetical protein